MALGQSTLCFEFMVFHLLFIMRSQHCVIFILFLVVILVVCLVLFSILNSFRVYVSLIFSSSCVKFLVKFIYMSVSTLCNYHFLFYLLTRCVLFAFLLILHPCLVDCDSVHRVLFSPTVSTDPNHYPVYIPSQSPFVRVSVIFLSCLPAPVCPSSNSQFRFR